MMGILSSRRKVGAKMPHERRAQKLRTEAGEEGLIRMQGYQFKLGQEEIRALISSHNVGVRCYSIFSKGEDSDHL